MKSLGSKILASPLKVRVLPFGVFLSLTFLQDHTGESGRYWIYAGKSLFGAIMLWWVWPHVSEMRWKFSPAALGVGLGVLALWVGLDPFVPSQDELWNWLGIHNRSTTASHPWNPFAQFGDGDPYAWFFVGARILGSTLVVPPLEEVFYRSFLYRWIAKPVFESVPLGQFSMKPFLLTALIFGFAHNEWLAGILCGAAYQGLICWKKNLGEAMAAHAITNLLLGVFIVSRNAWHFW